MPQKSKNDVREVRFLRVVQLPLLPHMVDEIHTRVADKSALEQHFCQLAIEGYAVALKPNPRGGYSASAMDVREGSPNAGKQVFGNGRTTHLALASVMVKLDELNHNTDWDVVESASGGSDVS